VSICDGNLKYKQTTDLPSRVRFLNLDWTDELFNLDGSDESHHRIMLESENKRFNLALNLVQEAFESTVDRALNSVFPAVNLVKDAILNRFKVHESGRIICSERFSPYKEHIYALEESMQVEPIYYCIYPESLSVPKNYRIQSISDKVDNFANRMPLLPELRGLGNEKLNEKAAIYGLNDLIFVHNSGFLGAAKSKASCIKLAELTMQRSIEQLKADK